MKSSAYSKTYTSYSGADIVATITPQGGKTIVVGELATISYSLHREVYPVNTLGRINAKGFCRGPRTIAGSLVFTVFDRHLVSTIVQQGFSGEPYSKFTDDDRQDMILNMKLDEMPPIDVTITMSNELGNQSTLRIYGVLFVDEGQVMSIEDVLTEQTVSYIASDIEMLRNTKDVGGV